MHTIVGKSEHAYPHIMSLATTKSGSFDASLLDAEDIYMSGEMRTEEENFSWRKLIVLKPRASKNQFFLCKTKVFEAQSFKKPIFLWENQ